MKDWNEFFESNEEIVNEDEMVNEDHKETKEEQVSWICETVKKFSDKQVEEIYNFVEELGK